jgi:hypothetical protein
MGLPGDGLYTGSGGGGHGYTILPGKGRYHMYDGVGGHMIAVSDYNRRCAFLSPQPSSDSLALPCGEEALTHIQRLPNHGVVVPERGCVVLFAGG